MVRRFAFICVLLIGLQAWAQRGHSSGSRSYSHRSYSSRSYSSPSRSYSSRSHSGHSSTRKPVHVGTHTRRNGTVVHSHSRSYPGTASTRHAHAATPRTHYAAPRTHSATRSTHAAAPRTHYAAPRTHSATRSTVSTLPHTHSTTYRSASRSASSSHVGEKRSEATKDAFKHLHPCPANGKTAGRCPGYVIDHKVALACGGVDSPFNMQWQTVAEGKAKDKWERKGCR